MNCGPSPANRNAGRILGLLGACALSVTFLSPAEVVAGPWVEVGRSELRSDIQILADAGVLKGPVSTWPLAWGDIASDIEAFSDELNDYELAALQRVRAQASREMKTGTVAGHARLAVAGDPVQIRSFENTPREDAEALLGASWTGDRFTAKLQGTVVSDPLDKKEYRLDGSYAGVALGNWSLALSAQDRWWGPGWQTNLLYSNNSRPVPSFTLDRNSTQAFNTKWLAWLGTWDLSVQVGQLEKERAVPNAVLFGMRFNFRPLDSLEIGLSRTAQLCGDGRPCNFDTWLKMLLGRDNRGDNVSPEKEPGNQLGGIDARWSHKAWDQPFALYTQIIGEDEGNNIPTKYLAQFGTETWGQWDRFGTYRMFLEWSDTTCDARVFTAIGGSNPDYDCAYNNKVYKTGYRYYGRSLGSSFDNDASIFTFGTVLTDSHDNSWRLRLGYGKLNRARFFDAANTVAQEQTRYSEIELGHRRRTRFGDFNVGVGYDARRNEGTKQSQNDARLFLEWVYNAW